MKKLVLLFAALLVAGCGEKEQPVSDAEAERILKGAVHIDDVAKLTRTAADISSLSKDDDGKVFWDRTGRAYSGWFKGRYESGEVEELIQVKDGWFNGLMTTWHKNGQKKTEVTYKEGEILHGPYMQWHENGQKEHEGIYKDDKENGPYTSWYENGQKWQESTFKDDKQDGLATAWHENGQKWREETFKDGKPEGLRTGWYENGQKQFEATYKDGEPDGLETTWHKNGQKWAEGTNKDGKPDGLWTAWHENGQKAEEVTYKDGKELSAKYWNSKGEEVETYQESRK